MSPVLRDSVKPQHSGELRFAHRGKDVTVLKRRVHQWRTDLKIRVDGREAYLARLEGGVTRGEVKQMARDWIDRKNDR